MSTPQKRRRALAITERHSIVTAWAERASGPGWSNALVWVIVRDGNGVLRQECLQPEEQTAEMHHLFGVSAAAAQAMLIAVESSIRSKP
jgi:hypothetical protein